MIVINLKHLPLTNYDINVSVSVLSLTPETLNIFIKHMETKGLFSIWNHHKCLSQLFLIHLNTYVTDLRLL